MQGVNRLLGYSHTTFLYNVIIDRKYRNIVCKTCIKVVPLCKLHLVAASRSYTCAQGGLDTVQIALVMFSLPLTSDKYFEFKTRGASGHP